MSSIHVHKIDPIWEYNLLMRFMNKKRAFGGDRALVFFLVSRGIFYGKFVNLTYDVIKLEYVCHEAHNIKPIGSNKTQFSTCISCN